MPKRDGSVCGKRLVSRLRTLRRQESNNVSAVIIIGHTHRPVLVADLILSAYIATVARTPTGSFPVPVKPLLDVEIFKASSFVAEYYARMRA